MTDAKKNSTLPVVEEMRVATTLAPVQAQEDNYGKIPFSPAVNITHEILNAVRMDRLDELPKRKKDAHGATRVEWVDSEGVDRILSIKSSDDKDDKGTAITLRPLVYNTTASTQKLFALFLQTMNKQGWTPEKLGRDEGLYSFPMKALVDLGIFTRTYIARNRYQKCAEPLRGFSYYFLDAKGNEWSDSLFKKFGVSADKKTAMFTVTTNFAWEEVFSYFGTLPRYYYALDGLAAALLWHICNIAHYPNNAQKILDAGVLEIGIESVTRGLYLIDTKETRQAKQLVYEPLRKAIDDINAAHYDAEKNREFQLRAVEDDRKRIVGIRAFFEGKCRTKYTQDVEKRNRAIELGKASKQRVKERAIAINLAAKMKRDDEARNTAQDKAAGKSRAR